MKNTNRRQFLVKAFCAVPALAVAQEYSPPALSLNTQPPSARQFKISLNAYSFNQALQSGQMRLTDLLQFCADYHFDGLDLTAYYFPGYPAVPSDAYLYEIKRQAFRLGLPISGTGVRNDFTEPDVAKRQESITLVKNWIDAAAKLGAPVIRIFSGIQNPAGYTREQILTWMVADIKTCVAYGKSKGVVVAIQNHHDFIKTAAETQKIMELVNSDWFGLILDIGSYRMGNPYQEIQKVIPYAVSWQIKEAIYESGKEIKPDLKKLFAVIQASDYRGYLPIETLGPGDPHVKVPLFLKEVRAALNLS